MEQQLGARGEYLGARRRAMRGSTQVNSRGQFVKFAPLGGRDDSSGGTPTPPGPHDGQPGRRRKRNPDVISAVEPRGPVGRTDRLHRV